MKIGIITYWQSEDNYGQLLQCWALQQYLSKIGHDPFAIRFMRHVPLAQDCQVKEKKKSLSQKASDCAIRIARIILVVPYVMDKRRRQRIKLQQKKELELNAYISGRNQERGFDDFRKQNLKFSDITYPTIESLRTNPPQADIYITGSDQVWNYELHPTELEAFFLQFGPSEAKRISYAPSIGHKSWPLHLKEQLRAYLSAFDAISVREKSAIPIVNSCGFDAQNVLDPTMLLRARDYDMLLKEAANSNKEPKVENIYIYSINYKDRNDIPWEDIKSLANEHNLRFIVTPGSGYTPCRELFDNVEYRYYTIPEWIRAISECRLLVTASFHGIIFAILFHKDFIYTPLSGRLAESNSRVVDLLESLDLGNRILSDKTCISSIFCNKIDWEEIDDRLDEARESSISFLKRNIKKP